jgi:chitin-binding protein
MHRVAAAVAASVLAAGAGLLVGPSPATAHGASVFPGGRQYFCWVDGLQDNGQIIPANPACQAAVAASGTTPLFNWFGNLNPVADGRTTGYIQDGQICDGTGPEGTVNGPFDFSPYNAMRDDWPRTHLTAGDTYTFRHNNWAAHPGRFDVYLTVQGWDPAAPLSWSDLELIDTAVNPPQTGGPGGLETYFWDVTFPANRSGQHLVFTHWVRSDSPENFYSCSDVVFDGGDGEVSGIGGDPGPIDPPDPPDPDEPPTVPGPAIVTGITPTGASVAWGVSGGFVTAYELVNVAGGGEEVLATLTGTPPATSTALTGLTPDTRYEVAVRARNDNTGDVSAFSQPAPFDTPAEDEPPPPGNCTVSYQLISQWNPGFHAEVTVTNDSASPVNGWQVGWLFADGQQVTQLWNGIDDQVGAEVTVTNESWNPNLPAGGGSVTFGFLGSWSGANSTPAGFTLNGTACTVA